MAGPSLRSRFVIGTLLWTAGLLMIGHMISLAVISRVPAVRGAHQSFIGAFVAFALMAIGLSQVRNGLSSVNHLRERLARVRDGRDRRIDGSYPAEVQPLVDDLNALLEHREQMVGRALRKAGDLAHGLKTPLAVLSHEAARTEAAGHHELATTMASRSSACADRSSITSRTRGRRRRAPLQARIARCSRRPKRWRARCGGCTRIAA